MFYVGGLFFSNGEFKQVNAKFENKESAMDFLKNNIKSKSDWLCCYIKEKKDNEKK